MLTGTKSAGLTKLKWEYREFIYEDWSRERSWVCLGGDIADSTVLALDFFWQTYSQQILNELDRWQDEGWEPLEEPRADSFKLSWQENTDAGFDPTDLILWLATFGIALILQILTKELPRHYITYEPVEFRLRMRRSCG